MVGTWSARHEWRANLQILSTYLPTTSAEDKSPWALSDFYDAVHVPPQNTVIPARNADSLPSTHLYPYQQRSVHWMIQRESVSPKQEGNRYPVSFSPVQDCTGKKCYVSRVRGMVIDDLDRRWDSTGLQGGILAEEMGLGKSVELISLMCLNKRDVTTEDVHDPYLDKMVKASGATLIITPPAILEQWRTEINRHAPHLKVFHYQGMARHGISEAGLDETTVEHLLQFDVILTSYRVLSKELYHATPPPDRSLRRKKVHERRTSPLVDISWWRICLDEAQMVENGLSAAATVARTIPRCNAWAVSGTPLRNNVTDLVGLLAFLRLEPFASSKDLFGRLDKVSFRDLISCVALRHTKDQVRSELDIPPQRRVVITVPFTEIEEEYYKDMFRQMCDACFLTPDGAPARNDRGLDHPETIERMRDWLVRLRQTCLHSHVGEKNRKAFGSRNRPLRTVQEVLQAMIDQNDTKLKSEARELVLSHMRCGHIYSFAKDLENPYDMAIPFYKDALQTTLDYVKSGREEIQAEAETLQLSDPSDAPEHEGSDGDDNDKDETSAKFARITILRRSLRSFLELEHACYFFIGNMHYQKKENVALTVPDSDGYHLLEKLEKEWYDKAQVIRQELLKETEARTQRQMQKMKDLRNQHQDLELPEIEDLGGIESSSVLEKLDVITEVINLQSAKLKEWRNKIIEILTLPLVDNDEEKETTGEEYETSLKVQDELYVYIQAFRTIVADMMTAVHGTEDRLVNHEMDQAVRQARDEDVTRRGHAPELLLKLAQERGILRSKPQHGSLKGVVASARQVITSLQYRADSADKRAAAELAIVQNYFSRIQEMFTAKTELTTDLEKEQEQFRLTMNLRLEFYRQIQHISETVEDYKDEMDDAFDARAYGREIGLVAARKNKIQGFRVRQTYLHNLRVSATEPQGERRCDVCFEPYDLGILTTCGHKASELACFTRDFTNRCSTAAIVCLHGGRSITIVLSVGLNSLVPI
jgi:E3 ubiquitin-protein ligase SHPRH